MLERRRDREDGGSVAAIEDDGSEAASSTSGAGASAVGALLQAVGYGLLPPAVTVAAIWYAHAETPLSGWLQLTAVGVGVGSSLYLAAILIERGLARRDDGEERDDVDEVRSAEPPPEA